MLVSLRFSRIASFNPGTFVTREILARQVGAGGRLIERYFRFAENQTSVKQELLGGLTTFAVMAYIVVVNPQILAQAGMPADGVVFATCLSCQVPTLVMGLYANYPIALAGMSLNAYFVLNTVWCASPPAGAFLLKVFAPGVRPAAASRTASRLWRCRIPKHSTAAGIVQHVHRVCWLMPSSSSRTRPRSLASAASRTKKCKPRASGLL